MILALAVWHVIIHALFGSHRACVALFLFKGVQVAGERGSMIVEVYSVESAQQALQRLFPHLGLELAFPNLNGVPSHLFEA